MNNKVLIVGGTASICSGMIKVLENNGYDIDLMTYKRKDKTDDTHRWQYLDLYDYNSLEDLISAIGNNKYEKIVLTIASSPSYKDILDVEKERLSEFYGVFFVNYMLLVRELLKSLSDSGQIVYISSIAANKPVDDVNYSTGKGAMQTFIMSMSTKTKADQAIYSISPGLIYDTPAFKHNDPSNYNNDISVLATKEGIAEIILSGGVEKNGKIIKIGL